MTDIWVCGTCHSINPQRGKRCYKCGAEQRTAATGEMANLRQEQAIASRMVVAYRPAGGLAFVTGLLLLVFAGATIGRALVTIEVSNFFVADLERVVEGAEPDIEGLRAVALAGARWVLTQALVILPLLVFFAVWLSRVVANVPALGGGVPGTTPGRALISTLLPIVNLLRVPGIVQDVLYRLDPRGGGLFMVGIAWVGLVGSAILSFFAGWYIDLRTTFDALAASSPAEAFEAVRPWITAAVVLQTVTAALIGLGSLVLILLLLRIERRSRMRDAEIRAAAGV